MKTTWLTYRYCRCRAHSSQAERSTILTCFEQRSLESCSMWCLLWCPALMIWSQDVGWLIGFELAIGYKVTIKVESIFVQTLLVTIVFYLSNAMSGVLCCCSFPGLRYYNTHISYIILLFLDDENLILPRGIIRHQILNNIHNTWQRSATWHDRILKPILANFHTINLLNPRN